MFGMVHTGYHPRQGHKTADEIRFRLSTVNGICLGWLTLGYRITRGNVISSLLMLADIHTIHLKRAEIPRKATARHSLNVSALRSQQSERQSRSPSHPWNDIRAVTLYRASPSSVTASVWTCSLTRGIIPHSVENVCGCMYLIALRFGVAAVCYIWCLPLPEV